MIEKISVEDLKEGGFCLPCATEDRKVPATTEMFGQKFCTKHALELHRHLRKQLKPQIKAARRQNRTDFHAPTTAGHDAEPMRSEKVGRNDPCPCGSGKKHKKCCIGQPNEGKDNE